MNKVTDLSDAICRRFARDADALKKSNNLIVSLVAVTDSMAEILASIRYQNWPVTGMGVGLTAERLDEVLASEESVARKAKRHIKNMSL